MPLLELSATTWIISDEALAFSGCAIVISVTRVPVVIMGTMTWIALRILVIQDDVNVPVLPIPLPIPARMHAVIL